MPRFKHRDMKQNPTQTSSSSPPRYFSSRMRIGGSHSITVSRENDKETVENSNLHDDKMKHQTNDEIEDVSTPTKVSNESSSSNDDPSSDDTLQNSVSTSSSTSPLLSSAKKDMQPKAEEDDFVFDFDDDSTPPKAIIWKDTKKRKNNEDNSASFSTIHNNDLFDIKSPSAKTPVSGILKDKSNYIHNGANDCDGNVAEREAFTSISNSGKKKNYKVTFGEDVQFRQKTPIKVKRMTKKSLSRRKSGKSLSSISGISSRNYRSHDDSTLSSSSSSKDSSPPSLIKRVVTPTNDSRVDDSYLDSSSVLSLDSITSWIPNRAVGIDSRILDTFSGDAVGKMFQKYVLDFLKSSCKRGLRPKYLATTTLKETKHQRSSNDVIESKVITSPKDDDDSSEQFWKESLLPLICIKPPSNIGNTMNRNVIHVPRRLLASDSWRIFGDLVESVLSAKSSSDKNKPPVEVSIISNDVAFFTDVNIDAHKRAVARLWERLRSKFQSNQIRSINIIIFESKVSILSDPCGSGDNDENENCSIDATPHRFKVAYCVQEIKNHIVKLAQKDFANCSEGRMGMPVNFHFDLKEFHPIMFSSILQEWSRDVINSATSDCGQICFDLPETFDGTQCTVTLNLSYSIMPYRLGSMLAKNLVDDLRLLSESHVEVLQLVQLDSIDLSLIYGTPMTVKPGFGGDVDQFRHMQVLSRSLFNYLASNDVAMVLRSSLTETVRDNDSSNIYLLMGQVQLSNDESKEGTSNKAAESDHGVLCRYVARAEHIIEEQNECEYLGRNAEDEELVSFSNQYISESLGLLECFQFTPYQNQTRMESSATNNYDPLNEKGYVLDKASAPNHQQNLQSTQLLDKYSDSDHHDDFYLN